MPLCRLRYVGSAHNWRVAIYRASHDDYQESIFPSGLPIGTCQDASTSPAASISTTPPDGTTSDPRRQRSEPPVSCVGYLRDIFRKGLQDVLCRFGPDERCRVLVPVLDPLPDVVLWGEDALVNGELAELHRPVLAVQRGDHAAVGDVERGEQARGAVTDVVAGAPLRPCPASTAAPAGSGPGPASRTSHPRTTPPPARAGGGRARPRRRPCPRTADRWTA